MSPRLAVLLGLLAGVVTAALALGAILALAPGPVHPTPTPFQVASPSPAEASPSPSIASPSAGPSDGASPSVAPSGSDSAAPSASGSAFGVGLPAPALRVTRVGGGTIDLAQLRGKPVWVNFMQTTCPPCIDEFPLMNGFAVRYADSGLVIVAIDIKEDAAQVKAFAEGLHATFPVGLDSDGSAQRAWGAFALPVHFWIDASGIVRSAALGGIGPDLMASSLQKILPGTTVTP
jgi:cytochrome c biogenesis protein CcmG/thiol:disulfide interchange protein DsbE